MKQTNVITSNIVIFLTRALIAFRLGVAEVGGLLPIVMLPVVFSSEVKMRLQHVSGEMKVGDTFTAKSILDSEFDGRIAGTATDPAYGAG